MKNQQTKPKREEFAKPDYKDVARTGQSRSTADSGPSGEGSLLLNLRWFVSSTLRRASQMHKHVGKILSAQRDILSPQAIAAMEASMLELRKTIATRPNKEALHDGMTNLENAANKWLKPYPNAGMRENVEVLLVAIAVAMAIRTFFLQPFKIPTGSMQPTLYGITSEPDFKNARDFSPDPSAEAHFDIPNPIFRFFAFWISGVSYTHVVAKSEGAITAADEPTRFLLFNLKQTFYAGNTPYTVWFPPDDMLNRAGLQIGDGKRGSVAFNPRRFKPGEDMLKLKVYGGDHLFVDRLTYNFRRPQRGDIIVFETEGIEGLPPGQFYIKRLVALGPERVAIGNDRHLIIDGKRLDNNTRHFERVYSFDPAQPPQESHYSGHVNNFTAPGLAPLFPNEKHEVAIPPNHYMVMGDNTMNSSDSRFWGYFPREKVIGRSFFIYWPIGPQNGRSSRFGWGYR